MGRSKTHTHSIIEKMIVPFLMVSILQLALFLGVLIWGGIVRRMNQYSFDQMRNQALTCAKYLEETLNNPCLNISHRAKQMNQMAELYFAGNQEALSGIEKNMQQYQPLLNVFLPEIIELLQTEPISGVFCILNTQDLTVDAANGIYENKPGIYIRRADPLSNTPVDRTDILAERMPFAMIEQYGFTKDIAWQPEFVFEQGETYYSFLYEPYQAAKRFPNKKGAELGYWSPLYSLHNDSTNAISYSIPLILENGQMYGVLGIEFSTELLKQMLPENTKEEMFTEYVLAYTNQGGRDLYAGMAVRGNLYPNGTLVSRTLSFCPSNDYHRAYLTADSQGEALYAAFADLTLYSDRTIYPDQNWSLIKIAVPEELFSFSENMYSILVVILLILFVIGGIGIFFIGYLAVNPFRTFSLEIQKNVLAEKGAFTPTGITELADIQNFINKLYQNLHITSQHFSEILELSSMKTAGFIWNSVTEELFITTNYPQLFPMDGKTISSSEELKQEMEKMDVYLVQKEDNNPCYLYHIPSDPERWIRLTIFSSDFIITGIAEEISKFIQQEKEEDSPLAISNPHTFQDKMADIFEHSDKVLKTAALLILDVDDFAALNEWYGYDFGDSYIKYIRRCLMEFNPPEALIARMSRDRFYIFYYGYETKNEIEILLKNLKRRLDAESIPVLNEKKEETIPLQTSGEIVWYPGDSQNMEDFARYADDAVKHIKHGTFTKINENPSALE